METFTRQAQLPTELLRQIVLEYVSTYDEGRKFEEPRHSYKPPWSSVEPLTLASKVLRQLALEAWFEVYYVRTPDDLLHAWPEFELWTKELHCVELGTDLRILPVQWDFRAFHRLRKLRIDFDPMQSNAMLLMRFDHPRHIASQIQELEIYDISWPSPMAIHLIADAFPRLRTLKLSQDLMWCNLCNICRFSTFRDHPPEEITYDKSVGLPSHYATYLRPLIKLEDVVLTVGYGLGGSYSLSENNGILWTGECDACMDMMFSVGDFRQDWVEKKKTMMRPPSLKTVKWRFRYKNVLDVVVDLDEDEDEVAQTADESDAGNLTIPGSDE
ncbi:hypothetical protein DICSQDRAFT_178943 [Dichomitus squalens LYAD-421 SS1]|uniref:F-box domain-containing protein n=1 Tax=Dichomitus squalens TaxID=114155 RepID=A0A4Q9PMP3_9APHY|nr:uncharacterized protein DICSQDRAFT_178943 [Dichomitus squalens LYAD-421 SS1]EJF63661.1 hypothetical protein DICSQDRAFT_178943 [Dichomitus squalens LYAD-421 SS1]TBU23950.1 hypothetical protein BD311DRAFT_672810 [Dichomitus squalens]TBU55522.1 hypothetical protein BD310DRAFT_682659 [Dichomitus squalens]